MKLNIYSEETMPTRKTASPKRAGVSFNHRGMVSFSTRTAELIGLKKGDTICLGQDDKDTTKWYFFKDPSGYALKAYNKGGVWFSHVNMVQQFLASWGLPLDKPFRAAIAHQPVKIAKKEYWLLDIPTE